MATLRARGAFLNDPFELPACVFRQFSARRAAHEVAFAFHHVGSAPHATHTPRMTDVEYSGHAARQYVIR